MQPLCSQSESKGRSIATRGHQLESTRQRINASTHQRINKSRAKEGKMVEQNQNRRRSIPSPLSPVGPALQYAVDDENLNLSPVIGEQVNGLREEPSDNDSRSSGFDVPRSRLAFGEGLQEQLLHTRLRPAKLNGLNYLNVATYLVNAFVSYGIGIWGLDGLVPTRVEISQENQTLVTPPEWARYIWIPILTSEFLFAVAQLTPHYRARPIVQCGTGYFFFYTCLIQIAWTLCFAFRQFVLSFVAVVGALLSMASLLANQHSTRAGGRRSRSEYWLFEFPFYMHFGWLILCCAVQLSLLWRGDVSSAGSQLAADIVALGVMLPPATFFVLEKPGGPDFVVPLIIVFSYISIGISLDNPNESLREMYEHAEIVAIRSASFAFATMVGFMLVPTSVILMTRECCTINVVELDQLSAGSRQYANFGLG